MSQIDDLQARITRALDRIGQRLDTYEPGVAQGDVAAMQQELAMTQTTLAEVQERAAAQQEQALSTIESLRQEMASQYSADLQKALDNARQAAAEAESAAVSKAVTQALEKAAGERAAVVAAIRAEAEAAISAAQAAVPAASGPSADDLERAEAEIRLLRDALEDEKLANSQLQERMRHLKAKMLAGGGAAAGITPQAVAALDAEVQRLRAANATLAQSNAALREANAMGVGDTQLINKALAAELEAMRAGRAVDAAEAQALIETLEPLLTAAGVDTASPVEAADQQEIGA